MAVAGLLAQVSFAQDNLHSSSNPFNVQTQINNWTPPSGHQTYADYGSTGTDFLFSPRYLTTYFYLGEGVTIPVANRNLKKKPDLPPDEAIPFIQDPFYPHLTTLIDKGGLPQSLKKRLSAYQKQRDAAANALWIQLSKIDSISAQEAATAWAEFERIHASDWAKIDRERESLLSRFQAGGFMKPGVNLKDALSLVESADVHQESVPVVSLAVIRHFVKSLSMEQRDLLGEIVHEVSSLDSSTTAPSSSDKPSRWDQQIQYNQLTDEQSSALKAYLETKNELKDELVESLTLFVPIYERKRDVELAKRKIFSSDPKVVQAALREILDSNEFILNWKKLESAASRLRDQQAPKFEEMRREWHELMQSLDDVPIATVSSSPEAIGNPVSFKAETLGLMSASAIRLLNYANPRS